MSAVDELTLAHLANPGWTASQRMVVLRREMIGASPGHRQKVFAEAKRLQAEGKISGADRRSLQTMDYMTRDLDSRRAPQGGGDGMLGNGIGDDMAESDLDNLWAALTGRWESDMSAWWEDKPHQIAYRLLLRLTRAENALRTAGLLPAGKPAGATRWVFAPKTASGRRRSWAMHITGLNARYEAAERPSAAFHGSYLRAGAEYDLPIGTLVLEVVPRGSTKNGWREGLLYYVGAAGLEPCERARWPHGLLTLKDAVGRLLGLDAGDVDVQEETFG